MNRSYSWLVVALTLTLNACGNAQEDISRADRTMTEQQRTLYALGAALANNLRELELTADERRMVLAGFDEVSSGQPSRVDVATEMPNIETMRLQRQAVAIAERRKQGDAFIEQRASQPGAIKSASGLIYREIEAGEGRLAAEHDTVLVDYEAALIDGKVVDSSRKRGKPTEFRVNGVIACWKEALLKMRAGGRSQVVCPPDLAYGDGGSPPAIPPAATLIFDIELHKVSKPEDSQGS